MNHYKKQVYYSETGRNSYMRADALCNEISDIINYHSESIGKGVDFLLGIKRTWFVLGWHIVIDEYPKLLDEIELKTWGYDLGALFCSRNITLSKGERLLAYADSLWAVYDAEKKMLTKIKPIDTDGYDYDAGLDMERVDRKMTVSCETLVDELAFDDVDIDYNDHVNNMAYLKHAFRYIPRDAVIKDIKIVYNKQTKLGERLKVFMDETKKGVFEMKMTGGSEADIRATIVIAADGL